MKLEDELRCEELKQHTSIQKEAQMQQYFAEQRNKLASYHAQKADRENKAYRQKQDEIKAQK